jgi:proline dehydrogenase
MLRSVILAAARSPRVERLIETAPVTRDVVRRFVAGTTVGDVLRISLGLAADGLAVSLDYLGEDTRTPEQAEATRGEYLRLIAALADAGLTPNGPGAKARRPIATGTSGAAGGSGTSPLTTAEVSLKLSALGQRFDEKLAYEHARAICAGAAAAGTTVTIDMEDHATTDSTLDILSRLRVDYPGTGAVLQAYLRRTEGDCRELAGPGSRVRLCKGAYREPETVAYGTRLDIDKSYVRCLNILMSGEGYPMLATHDPRLVAIAEDRAKWFDRAPESFEFQMLYGVRPAEQARLVDAGYTMRVYVPYGTQWYGYLMRRLAERPANVAFFARALGSRD